MARGSPQKNLRCWTDLHVEWHPRSAKCIRRAPQCGFHDGRGRRRTRREDVRAERSTPLPANGRGTFLPLCSLGTPRAAGSFPRRAKQTWRGGKATMRSRVEPKMRCHHEGRLLCACPTWACATCATEWFRTAPIATLLPRRSCARKRRRSQPGEDESPHDGAELPAPGQVPAGLHRLAGAFPAGHATWRAIAFNACETPARFTRTRRGAIPRAPYHSPPRGILSSSSAPGNVTLTFRPWG
jgi:hypothetical protein